MCSYDSSTPLFHFLCGREVDNAGIGKEVMEETVILRCANSIDGLYSSFFPCTVGHFGAPEYFRPTLYLVPHTVF